MEELLKYSKEWADKFDTDFEALKMRLEKRLSLIEASILRRILAELLPALKVEEGYIRGTVSNIAKSNLIDRIFQEISRDEMAPILTMYAEAMLEIPGKNAEWYILSGNDKKKVKAIANDTGLLRQVIGMDDKGELLQGGYLQRLGQTEIVRDRIKQYVVTSIASGQGAKSFSDGLSNLVKGNRDIDGALTGYFQQYAFDTYAKVREIDNQHFANELGLSYFVYQGGVIQTSRDFCIKKNGKVFSREEALKNWPKDPDLIDKAHLASYRPLIDRGRNNCRHFLMFISEERANEIKAKQ